MSGLAYSKRFVDLKPDLSDPSLVGAWDLRNADNKVVDLTKGGNNGQSFGSRIEPTILGNFRRFLPNSGARGIALGSPNAFPLNDLTVRFWYRIDHGATVNAWLLNYYSSVSDAWGLYTFGSGDIRIYDDIGDAGALLYTTTIPKGKLIYCVAVMNSKENLLYVEKKLVGSGTLSSDFWSSFSGTLYCGGRADTASPMQGIVGALQVHNESKNADWIKNDYLRGAKAIQFKTDYGVTESEENQTGGLLGGTANPSPFKIKSGTFRITSEIIGGQLTKIIECVSSGRIAIKETIFEGTPTEMAYGTPEIWVSKADASVMNIAFIASNDAALSDPSQNGYNIQLDSAERYILQKITSGVSTDLTVSDTGLIPVGSWAKLNAPRAYNDEFTSYVNGVEVVAASGSNPVVDGTHKASNHFVIDMDTGDKVAYSDKRGGHSIVKYLGAMSPYDLYS